MACRPRLNGTAANAGANGTGPRDHGRGRVAAPHVLSWQLVQLLREVEMMHTLQLGIKPVESKEPNGIASQAMQAVSQNNSAINKISGMAHFGGQNLPLSLQGNLSIIVLCADK